MPIPDQVKRQADQAKQQLDAARAQAESEATADTVDGSGPQESESQAQEQAQPQQPAQNTVDWQARYNVLQGKYNAEVPKAQQEVAQLRAELQELRDSQRQAAVQAQEQMQQQAAADHSAFLSEKLLLDDDDQSKLNALIEDRAQRIVQQQMGGVAEDFRRDKTERFYGAMNPEYQYLQNDPSFLAWVDQPVPGTGSTPRQFMMSAYQRLDAQNFNAWIEQYQSQNGKATTQSLGSNPALANKVTPRTTEHKSSSDPDGGEKTITATEYSRRANRAQSLLRRGKREQADRIMTELNQLHRQGLIRPG